MLNWALLTWSVSWALDIATAMATTDQPFHAWLICSMHYPIKQKTPDPQRGGWCILGDYLWPGPFSVIEQSEIGPSTTHTFIMPACTLGTITYTMVFPASSLSGAFSYGPIIPVPCTPSVLAPWQQHAIAFSANFGPYETWDFTDSPNLITGVPTWTSIATGLDLTAPFQGFRSDPTNPLALQYLCTANGLYSRIPPNPWVYLLTANQAALATGGNPYPSSNFQENPLDLDQNQPGFIGVLFLSLSASGYQPWFCYSTDYGASWNYVAQDARNLTGASCGSLQIGKLQGSSVYTPGFAIYSSGRRFTTNRVRRSINHGLTWQTFTIPGAPSNFGITVDPTSQDRLFVHFYRYLTLYRLARSTDHAATYTIYDLLAPIPLGSQIMWGHLCPSPDQSPAINIATSPMGSPRNFFRTPDDGLTWIPTLTQTRGDNLGIKFLPSYPQNLYLHYRQSASGPAPQTLWASQDETFTMIPKAGANAAIPGTGGGDSIPYNCGGIRHIELLP